MYKLSLAGMNALSLCAGATLGVLGAALYAVHHRPQSSSVRYYSGVKDEDAPRRCSFLRTWHVAPKTSNCVHAAFHHHTGGV